MLRVQPSQLISNLFYNSITRDGLLRFISYHANYHARYLVYGGDEWPQELKDQARR